MEVFWISSYICMFCILQACYVCNVPHLEGGITGNTLDFNCSTSQKPLSEVVEIVVNGKSEFQLAHSNTTCNRKRTRCEPNDCSCTANWFQWKMTIQDTTVILKVQCLMRFEENIKKIVKANILFNGSYFVDDLECQTTETQDKTFTSTTKATPYISSNSGNTIRNTFIVICVLLLAFISGCGFYKCKQYECKGYTIVKKNK